MASNGERTTNLTRQFALDEVLGNTTIEGVLNTVRVPFSAFADQLAGTGTFVFGNAVYAATEADLLAATPPSATAGGIVLDDPDPTKNGYWVQDDAEPSGWAWKRGFRQTFGEFTNWGGTANAQTAELESWVSPSEVRVYFGQPAQDNTGPMTLNGTPVVNAAGNALSAGEWTGTVLFIENTDGDYQLLIDAGAAAAAAQSATDAAAALAEFLTHFLGNFADDAAATTAAGTPVDGQFYWNTTSKVFRYYDGSAWNAFPYATVADDSLPETKLSRELSARVGAAFDTVAELVADTSLTYSNVAEGDLVEIVDAHYEVAASGTPVAAPYISNAASTVFKVLPDGRKAFVTSAFGTGNLSETFAAACDAVLEARENTTFDVWFQDTPGIVIPPGVYNLDAPLEVIGTSNLAVYARGALIRQLTESFHAFRIVDSPMCEINGLAIDLRNNNAADEAILIGGQSSNLRFNSARVQANSSNADFACVRMKQGDASGFDDNNRDKGNFWVHFEDFWCRELSGSDANNIPTVFDLQGCQNAFSMANSKLSNFGNAILVRNQNNSLSSGISNSIHFYNDKFESYTGAALRLQADGGASISVAGGSMIGCRFETGGAVAHSALSAAAVAPILLAANTIVSSVSNYITGVTGDFNSLDAMVTPGFATPRMLGSRPFFVGHIGATVGGSLEVLQRQRATGGAIAIVRSDGTVDGRFSQRVGGGLEIDGGTANRVKISNLPTSSAGLATGDIWNDAGTLKIV